MKKSHFIILGIIGLCVFVTYLSLFQIKVHNNTVQSIDLSFHTEKAFRIENTKFNSIFKNPIMRGADSFANLEHVYILNFSEAIEVHKNNHNEIANKKNERRSIEEPDSTSPDILRSFFSTILMNIENKAANGNNFSNDVTLGTPTNLTLKSVSSSEVTIDWQIADGAEGYNIYYCEDKTTHVLNCSSINVQNNQVTLRDLNPESKYEIDILAFNMEGHVSESSKIMFAETLSKDSDKIEIPGFYNHESAEMESTCYNDCANTYAIKTSQGYYFDLSQCSRRCKVYHL